jgi:hypothetical protein
LAAAAFQAATVQDPNGAQKPRDALATLKKGPPRDAIRREYEKLRIARDDQAVAEEIEALALEGLNSGESMKADDRYWADKRQRLMDRHQRPGPR